MKSPRTINSTIALTWLAASIAGLSIAWCVWSIAGSVLALRDEALSNASTIREDRVQTDALETINAYRTKVNTNAATTP